tara:strand:+ start:234 stop:365 length:132 start_codon:yes stop_codon:yes gene_type:complete
LTAQKDNIQKEKNMDFYSFHGICFELIYDQWASKDVEKKELVG